MIKVENVFFLLRSLYKTYGRQFRRKCQHNSNRAAVYLQTGTVAHELGHALGLIHEQSRPDRDDHIRIHVDKINRASIHNFQTYYDAKIPEGVRYDLNSIMHYSPRVRFIFF